MIEYDRRWVKVLHDLWLYKSRTVVVVTAIALGVAGIGIVSTTLAVLVDNYVAQYWASNPAHVVIGLTPFGESTLRKVRDLPEVVSADARHIISARVEIATNQSYPLVLQAIPDFKAITVDELPGVSGTHLPPPKGGIVLERSVLNSFAVQVGDSLPIRMPDGKVHNLTVAGFVLDSVQLPTPISSQVYGYVTFETSFWLEQDEKGVFNPADDQIYDRLLVITRADPYDKADIEEQGYLLKRDIGRLDPNPPLILSFTIPPAGKPTLQDNLDSMWIVLQAAGIASLALSGFLVTNIMSALIAQQIKQIGILKAIGARTRQIVMLYLVMSMVLGGIAFLIALPLGVAGAYGVTRFIARILNSDVIRFYLPAETILLQVGTALLVPALATIVPALGGTRMTAREAMFSSDNAGMAGGGPFSKVLAMLSAFPTPITLSIRNVFRQKLRMVLTLVALSIAGSTFIAVIGVRDALDGGFDDILNENNFDIQIRYRLDAGTTSREVEKTILEAPGVIRVETWKATSMRRVFDDGTLSGTVAIVAMPTDTQMLQVNPVQGHWLMPDDRNGLYINFDALETLGSDALANPIKLELNGSKEMWHVVGVAGRTLSPYAYIRMQDYDRYFKTPPPARIAVIQTRQRDRAYVEGIEADLLDRFKAKKWPVDSSLTLSRNLASARSQINNVIYILLGTAALIAVVGGLGLANTLELSVMERTREIGILRSLGAKSYLIRLMVITESVTICGLSAVIGAATSTLFGTTLSNLIGSTLLARRLIYSFPQTGLLVWIGIILALSIIASLAPAQSAINLTVRDTLAYE